MNHFDNGNGGLWRCEQVGWTPLAAASTCFDHRHREGFQCLPDGFHSRTQAVWVPVVPTTQIQLDGQQGRVQTTGIASLYVGLVAQGRLGTAVFLIQRGEGNSSRRLSPSQTQAEDVRWLGTAGVLYAPKSTGPPRGHTPFCKKMQAGRGPSARSSTACSHRARVFRRWEAVGLESQPRPGVGQRPQRRADDAPLRSSPPPSQNIRRAARCGECSRVIPPSFWETASHSERRG